MIEMDTHCPFAVHGGAYMPLARPPYDDAICGGDIDDYPNRNFWSPMLGYNFVVSRVEKSRGTPRKILAAKIGTLGEGGPGGGA